MYTTFIFSFTELTTAIPHAGGPFAYSYCAFEPIGGYIARFSTLVEFVFAPPAIALAIGEYLNVQFPALDARTAAVGAYAVFTVLNIAGVTPDGFSPGCATSQRVQQSIPNPWRQIEQ